MKTIALTKGKVAVVDDEDHVWLRSFDWHTHKAGGTCYAVRSVVSVGGRVVSVYMHRAILCSASAERVDHIDGDGLNNQRSNLRGCTHAQNIRAQRRPHPNKTSRFRGVCRANKVTPLWIAQIQHRDDSGRMVRPYLGYFESEEDAARAYDRAAIQHFGSFAVTNFPREEYGT